MIYCEKCSKPVRVGTKALEDGKKDTVLQKVPRGPGQVGGSVENAIHGAVRKEDRPCD